MESRKIWASVGRAVVDKLALAVARGSPKVHSRSVLQQSLRASGVSKRLKFAVGKVLDKAKGLQVKDIYLGAKKTRKCTEEGQLYRSLTDLSKPQTTWSRKTDRGMRTLLHSKRRTWAILKRRGQTSRGYRQFCRMLVAGRLGLGVSRKSTDLCPACQSWKLYGQKQTEHCIAEFCHLLSVTCAACLADFRGPDIVCRAESVAWVEAWLACLRAHACQHEDCPATGVLGVAINTFEEEHMERVRLWSFHWALNERLRESFAAHQAGPAPGTLYMVFDFEAPCNFPPLRPHSETTVSCEALGKKWGGPKWGEEKGACESRHVV